MLGFHTNRTVELSVSLTCRSLSPGKFHRKQSNRYKMSGYEGTKRDRRNRSQKISKDPTGNRTRNLHSCVAVPLPTASPLAPNDR